MTFAGCHEQISCLLTQLNSVLYSCAFHACSYVHGIPEELKSRAITTEYTICRRNTERSDTSQNQKQRAVTTVAFSHHMRHLPCSDWSTVDPIAHRKITGIGAQRELCPIMCETQMRNEPSPVQRWGTERLFVLLAYPVSWSTLSFYSTSPLQIGT